LRSIPAIMKIAGLILLGCIGYTMASFSTFNAASSIFRQVARMKRRADNQPQCINICNEATAMAFARKIKSSRIPFDKKPSSLNQIICQSHNPTLFDIVCDLYKKHTECAKKCPANQAEDFPFTLIDESAKFMCTARYHDFKKQLPCVFRTCNAARPICEPECQHYQTRLEDSLHEFLTVTHSTPKETKDRIENIASIACGYVDCTMDCLYPKFEKGCGHQAENLERELMQHSIDAVKKYVASAFQLDFEWPESCHTLAEHTFSTGNHGRNNKK